MATSWIPKIGDEFAGYRIEEMVGHGGMSVVSRARRGSREQLEGKDIDGHTDVYSLGCVVYSCLTGNPAYEQDSEVALSHAHLLEAPPSNRGANLFRSWGLAVKDYFGKCRPQNVCYATTQHFEKSK